MAIDLKQLAVNIGLLGQKIEILIEKEVPIVENVVNAFLPSLSAMEAELAKALVDVSSGQDVAAIEDMIAFIIQMKQAIAAAKAASKASV